jgi:hypothetical protein
MSATGYVGAIISIFAGCLGLIWSSHVSRTIGLQIPGRHGGLFISAGMAVVVTARSDAALVLGAAWTGVFVDPYLPPK